MRHIIDYAYTLFCNQVAGGLIEVENEASMQLFLSDILLQLGRLNVFSTDENFNMRLEKIPTLRSVRGRNSVLQMIRSFPRMTVIPRMAP